MKTKLIMTMTAAILAFLVLTELAYAGGTCGNFFIDPREECDDGNTFDQDGCSSQCLEEINCENPLIIDFDELSTGEVVKEQYLSHGIRIEAVNKNTSHPNKAIVFNSSNPTGGDIDLGTPATLYSGPGVGEGGITNNLPLENVLIIAENDIDANNDSFVDNPDDEEAGGSISFHFDKDIYEFNKLTLLNIDTNNTEVYIEDRDKELKFIFPIKNLKTNSAQSIYLNITQKYAIDILRVTFSGEGAIDRLILCPCPDQDNDGVCDNQDLCEDSMPDEPVDENGCDIFQFCSGFSCGWDCLFADWKDNEPNEQYPRDCTIAVPLSNGFLQKPACVPTEFSNMCAG